MTALNPPSLPIEEIDDPPTNPDPTEDDGLQTLGSHIHQAVGIALRMKTPAHREVDELIVKLDHLTHDPNSPSSVALRNDLENLRQETQARRCREIAEVIVAVTATLGIKLKLDNGTTGAAPNKRARLSKRDRDELSQRLIAALREAGPDGLKKAQIADRLQISIHQAKGLIAQAPAKLIGHGDSSRYVYADQATERGD